MEHGSLDKILLWQNDYHGKILTRSCQHLTRVGNQPQSTGDHRLLYRWYKDDAGPAEVQQNYRAKNKKAQISRKPWDSNLLLNTIEVYIWIHQNQ